jgi:leucyl-tRNA synthetase
VAVQRPPDAWFRARDVGPTLDCDAWPEAFIGEGTYVNSSNDSLSLNGERTMAEAKSLINTWLAARGHGYGTVTYKLRDWLFSRQRYWGEPFPIVYDDETAMALPESMLPVALPETDQFTPRTFDPDDEFSEPESPLDRLEAWKWVELDLGDGPKLYRRDTNVMPQWAGSCWYELRYLDPTNEVRFVDPAVEQYWMGPQGTLPNGLPHPGGVDLYVGGVEHAVLHLLYARFWHKVLYDLGYVSSKEPYFRLFNQGYILAAAFTDERGIYVEAVDVVERDGQYFFEGGPVTREYGKMGKSLKNAVAPDDMYEQYGADTLRLYEMFMGPLDASRPWETQDVVGMYRFLQRLWRNLVDEQTGKTRVVDTPADDDTRRLLHRTIDAVRADMEHLRFNTAIAKLIELNNHLTSVVAAEGGTPREVAEPFVLMLAPLAPHLGEELWSMLGHESSLTYVPFPQADPALLVAETVEYPIQINGKVRSRITVPATVDEAAVQAAALADARVVELLAGATPKKVIVIAGRLVNIVV